MKIYRGITEVLDLGFEPEGTERKELMVEHTVSFRFEWQTYIKLEKGDSITYNGKKFYLKEDYISSINKSTNGFVYDLKFYDIMERMKDIKLKYNAETDFKLTTTGSQFLDVVVSSFSGITKGSFPEGFKEIHFENLSVFDALNLIAEAYNTEWWLNGSILNISKCEFGEPVLLRHDIELDEISVSPSSETMITRLYAKGSTRNIPRGYSKDNRLKLASGYVDLIPDLPESKIIEGVHIFEDIYPRQTTSIVEVIQGSAGDTPIFTIRGNNTFEITQNDVIAGQPLKIAFNTGNLAGREFELIIRDDNKFEIKYIQEGDLVIPNLTLKPEIGDEFFFFNFNAESVLPSLITQAENELLTAAQEYLDNLGSQLVYNCVTRSILCEENEIDLEVGQIVTIYSENIGTITSRVRGYTKELYNKYECTYQVGDYSSYSRLGQIEKETSKKADKEEIAEIKDNTGEIKNTVQNLDSKFLSKTKDLIKSIDTETALTDENVLSSLRVLLEIAKNNEAFLEDLKEQFLSKVEDDTAQGLITFLKGLISKSHSYIEAPLDVDKKLTAKEGMQIGASFAGGFTGHGGFIDQYGNAELQSLILRTFLEVPELRFNRVDVIAGDLWNTKGAGIIEEVDTVNQIITLKLEKGEIGRFRYDDIVMGIFHSFNDEDNSVDDYDDGLGNRRYSGFGTSYFRVTQILDAERYSKFRYELRPISPRYPKQFHPQPFMTSAAYGNFTNEERQTSMYQTTSYIRLLRNVNNWEFGIENIGMQWGDLSNLSIFGLDMTGYSAYMENVYFSGIIHQLSAKIKEQLSAQRVGGKNLLREYDIRFGFKYWGNTGEYTEFDINQIESTPQLQVQPNTLNWTFPIRYGTVVVTANGAWSITTPSWLNAYPAAGSGNKNVDLKAGEYKGRNARTGTVAVQSGVIQRIVSISQAGLTEFVTIDPILNVGYEAQTVTITGRSNSSKLTFTADTGYLEINLPAQYKVNGANVNNGSLIAGDPGALDEYSFSITVAVGENVEDFSIQNNIFATANGGQKAISTIVQRRTRVKVLGDTDNSIISIGDMIFHIN